MKKLNRTEILEGRLLDVLIRLSIPTMIGLLATVIYNFTDRIFISNFGEQELAAVGLAFFLQSIIISLSMALSVGINSALSNCIGAEDQDAIRFTTLISIKLAIYLSVLTTVGGLLALPFMYSVMGVEEDLLYLIKAYLLILLPFSFTIILPVAGNALLRSTGDSIGPMRAMLVGAVLNVVLDPIMIFGFLMIPSLGLQGAAIATVIARLISTIIVIRYILKNDIFREFLSISALIKCRLFTKQSLQIFNVSGPALVSGVVLNITMFVLLYSVKSFGITYVAAYTAAFAVWQVMNLPVNAIARSVVTVCGQSFGAKAFNRVSAVFNLSHILVFGITLSFVMLVIIFQDFVANIFFEDMSYMEVATFTIVMYVLASPFIASLKIAESYFQGIGKGKSSLYVQIIQLPVAFICAIIGYYYGPVAFWITFPICYFLAALFVAFYVKFIMAKI